MDAFRWIYKAVALVRDSADLHILEQAIIKGARFSDVVPVAIKVIEDVGANRVSDHVLANLMREVRCRSG